MIIAARQSRYDSGFVIGILGLVFAVLGVISDSTNIILVIESTSWLLLSIDIFIVDEVAWMSWILVAILKGFVATSKNNYLFKICGSLLLSFFSRCMGNEII